MAGHVLIVDAERGIRQRLRLAFEREGFRVTVAENGRQASQILLRGGIEVALLEVFLRGASGYDTLGWIKKNVPDVEVVLTGLGLPSSSHLKFLEAGAFAYVPKPLDSDLTVATVTQALGVRQIKLEKRALAQTVSLRQSIPKPILSSHDEWWEAIKVAAKTDLPILLSGPAGVRLRGLCWLIHAESRRSNGLCLHVPPTAVQASLEDLNSLSNVLEQINDGTIVLTEIQSLSHDVQSDLAEILETKRLKLRDGRRKSLGPRILATITLGPRPLNARPLDPRPLNPGPQDPITQRPTSLPNGMLLERLSDFFQNTHFKIPALKDRKASLEDYLATKLAALTPARELSADLKSALTQYSWPGNFDELDAVCRHIQFLPHELITRHDLPFAFLHSTTQRNVEISDNQYDNSVTLAEVEKRHIARVLAEHNGNKRKTARVLDINVKTLYNKIRTYNLDQ